MPHQCTNCGRTFPDGSKEMLSGCPDCGGNKFQFTPSSASSSSASNEPAPSSSSAATSDPGDADSTGPGTADAAADDSAPATERESVTARAAETVRDWVSSDETTEATSSSSSGTDPATDTPTRADETWAEGAASSEADQSPATETQSATADASQSAADAASQSGGADSSQPAADEPTQPAGRKSSHEADGDDHAWPQTATPESLPDDAPDEMEAFSEWPETARRPEDRRSTPDSSKRSETDSSEQAGPTAPSESATQSETSSSHSVDSSSNSKAQPTTTYADSENSAQADARSGVVSENELPVHSHSSGDHAGTDAQDQTEQPSPAESASTAEISSVAQSQTGGADTAEATQPDSDPTADATDTPPEHGRVVSEPTGDEPSIEDLREELNQQFESIKIVRPGQYELNLMELYNREEYIISLQEDGRYVIDVPDSWRDGDGDDA
ncbi:OapC/ArvC family zinc-ribbon domain-containing protein [Natronolimnobius baerhuensis]|uniref:Origin-associated protein OapC n=1 Tax=Natronolimnobius baerhuensis TaxID=253108 RepID=A0A202E6G8_9EURY|nr:Zn-ribbon containing protein [Natronolimnobius baerhuensis]OVE83510.1 hypothetical protein B2G88_13785 [Natronolimnobius baerhuensis]